MTHDISSIIGKHVKDMYGSHFGKILGTMTDIDGSIQTVGVDCGSDGLKEIRSGLHIAASWVTTSSKPTNR